MMSERRGGEVITGRSSNSEEQKEPGSFSDSELSVGAPVTTRIPLLPQHTFSPALLQVSIANALRLLSVLTSNVHWSASATLA